MNKKSIPQIMPLLGKEELENLSDVIKNKFVTEGPYAEKFSLLLRELTGTKHVLLTNNCSVGLYLSMLAMDIGEGDEVILPDFSFMASASSIMFAGAKPIFVDVRETDFNVNPDLIEAKITKKTKAIMPVHIYGQCADMNPIMDIANRYNLSVIEDAAQVLGVYYCGKDNCDCCRLDTECSNRRHAGTIGDVGVFSFYADKTITTGEGGAILTNNDKIAERLSYLRNQGRLNAGTFYHPALGLNFRMTDLQCAVGVAQMGRLEEIKRMKLGNYNLYKKYLSNEDNVKFIEETSYSNIVPFRANLIVNDLNGLCAYLEANGITTRTFFYPLHKQGVTKEFGQEDSEFPNTKYASENGLSLPVFCGLSKEDIGYICDKVKLFYNG